MPEVALVACRGRAGAEAAGPAAATRCPAVHLSICPSVRPGDPAGHWELAAGPKDQLQHCHLPEGSTQPAPGLSWEISLGMEEAPVPAPDHGGASSAPQGLGFGSLSRVSTPKSQPGLSGT